MTISRLFFLFLHAPSIPKNAYGPGDEPNPPKGINAWGEGPLRPKEISRYRDTLGQIRAVDNMAGRSATRELERFRPILINFSGSEIFQY